MAGGVHVKHEEMQAQAQRLAQNKNDLEAKLSEIKSQIAELVAGGFNIESASESFRAAQEKWDTAARNCVGELEVMAQYLGKASAAFADVDSQFTVKL